MWGEAELIIPGEFPAVVKSIQFGTVHRAPMHFVLAREGGVWKIVAVKALAARVSIPG